MTHGKEKTMLLVEKRETPPSTWEKQNKKRTKAPDPVPSLLKTGKSKSRLALDLKHPHHAFSLQCCPIKTPVMMLSHYRTRSKCGKS